MSEKLHNDEYDVKRRDGNAIGGDSNKIKLKMISYAIVMEVQEAFMQEELEKQNEELNQIREDANNSTLTTEEQNVINKNIENLKADIDSLKEVYDKFSEARTRFIDVSKKALKVHEDNIKQMKENDKEIAEEPELKVDISAYKEAQKVLDDAQSKDIFSNVDSNVIKQEVERAMKEEDKDKATGEPIVFGDYISSRLDENNLEKVARNVAEGVKENVVEIKKEEVTPEKVSDLLKTIKGSSNEQQSSKEVPPVKPTDTIKIEDNYTEYNNSIEPIFGEWANITPEEKSSALRLTSNDYVSFDGDTSIADYISKLEEETQEIKASREKTKDEKEQALQKTTAAEKARDEAKAKSEKTRNDVEEFKKYMPRIKEAQEAKRKEEEALKTEMAELASINLKKTALETEIAEYDEETRKSLEELREIKAILNGEEPEPKKEDLPKNVIK